MKGELYGRWLEAAGETVEEFVARQREACRRERQARRDLPRLAELQRHMQAIPLPAHVLAGMQGTRASVWSVGGAGGAGGVLGGLPAGFVPGRYVDLPRRLARHFFPQ